MATQTRQDAWISKQLEKANAAVRVLEDVVLQGMVEKQMYKGATREAQFKKYIEYLNKAVKQFNNDRKRL